jgi:hypothetical protein
MFTQVWWARLQAPVRTGSKKQRSAQKARFENQRSAHATRPRTGAAQLIPRSGPVRGWRHRGIQQHGSNYYAEGLRFQTYEHAEIALYHGLGNLPEPDWLTHKFTDEALFHWSKPGTEFRVLLVASAQIRTLCQIALAALTLRGLHNTFMYLVYYHGQADANRFLQAPRGLG